MAVRAMPNVASRAFTKIRASPSPTPKSNGDASRRSGNTSTTNLQTGDVRLTMGGEPTFVPIDDMDGAEWNNGALGTAKAITRADRFFGGCATALRPARLLHLRPGQVVSRASRCRAGRWLLLAQGRRADVEGPDPDRRRTTRLRLGTARDAGASRAAGATDLGVDPEHACPAYEDAWYYIWKERRLPVNVDPLETASLDEPGARRLRARVRAGLSTSVGLRACRLRRGDLQDGPRLESAGPGSSAASTLFLIPGDSPMGLRLPLDSCPG